MTKRCPVCKATDVGPERAELRRDVCGLTFRGEVEVEQCSACGEWTVSYEEGRRFELAVAQAVVEFGLDTAEAFKLLRKASGLRARDLAELLAVTPETVSRWETGRVGVERRALVILQTIVTECRLGTEATLERLRAMTAERTRPPRTIRLTLD